MTLKELTNSSYRLKDLPHMLEQQLVALGECQDSASILCSDDQIVKVRSSANTFPTSQYPWLSTRIVSHDKYGSRETCRLDAVLLQSSADNPTFGKLLRLFSTLQDIGVHEFAVIQLYTLVNVTSPINALFGEVHLRLSDTVILYVILV